MSQTVRTQSRSFFTARSLYSSRAFFLACALAAAVGCDVADSTSVDTDEESIASVEQALDGYSLSSPPANVNVGTSISVSFVAPAGHPANDWVGVYAVGALRHQYINWAYVPAGASGSVNITLPSSATNGQQYELRYMLGDYTLAASSTPFTAVVPAPDYTFPNGPYTSAPGSTFWFEWAGLSNHNVRDWFGLYRVGASNSQYLGWQFVGEAGATSGYGSLTMPANAVPGEMFEVRYMLSAGGVGGKSDPFAAGNLLTAPSGYVARDTDIVTSWTAPSSHAANDWIGIVPVDGLSTDFIAWAYVGSAGATSGSTTLHMPADAPDGHYELRYFLAGTYEIAGTSDHTFHVGLEPLVTAPASAVAGSTISVPWQAPADHATTDWIGLYKVGVSGLVTYSYVGAAGQTNGSVNITIPASASGTYELRYFINNTYTMTATSAQFPVTQ